MSLESATDLQQAVPDRVGHEVRVAKELTLRWGREVMDSPVGLGILLIAQPVIWYVLFGSLFGQLTQLPGFPVTSYRGYILPGIVMLIALDYISTGGMCIIDDIREGMLQKMWAAPISKLSIIAGRIVVMCLLSTLQIGFLLLLAYTDGVGIAAGLPGAALLLMMSAAFTAGITALSLSLAYLFKHEFAFNAVTSFAILPVVFVSNAFVPIGLMPDWVAGVAAVNPVTITVTGLRALVLNGFVAADVVPAVVFLAAFDVGAVLLAALTFRLSIERESLFADLCRFC